MAAVALPRILDLTDSTSSRPTGAMGLSLVFHCIVLAMLVGLRLAPVERPEGSVQVSLVSLPDAKPSLNPKPAPAPMEHKPAPSPSTRALQPPAPIPVPTPVRPDPVAKMAPHMVPIPAPLPPRVAPPAPRVTAPQVAPVTAAPIPSKEPSVKKAPDRLVNDVLKQVELPPDVPQFGDLPTPSSASTLRRPDRYKTDPAAQKLSTRLQDLRVPDTSPSSSSAKAIPTPEQTQTARPIVSSDILEKLQRPIDQIEQLPERRPSETKEVRVASAKPAAPSVSESPATADVTPATSIQASGAGTNRYWALVQQKINSRWVAPPVDLTQRFFQVVIRFTLDRSGRVIDVVVERSSGNDYYDNAGRRAVLAADPLPPFPPEMKERQLSPVILFSVGEASG